MTDFRVYSGVSNVAAFVARMLQTKLLLAGKRVVIHTESKTAADKLDKQLWNLPDQDSFIPHCLAEDPLATRTPVVISNGRVVGLVDLPADVLVCLQPTVPDGAISHPNFIVVLNEQLDDCPDFVTELEDHEKQGYKIQRFANS